MFEKLKSIGFMVIIAIIMGCGFSLAFTIGAAVIGALVIAIPLVFAVSIIGGIIGLIKMDFMGSDEVTPEGEQTNQPKKEK